MWLPALRRIVKLLVGISAGTIVLSGLFGLLLGASILRSIAIGFYVVGCFVLFGAFFFGNRGPVRARESSDTPGGVFSFGQRRWATKEEHEEAINSSAVLLPLGFVLILLGVVWDTHHSLF
ncbi:MAG TPA: hypothetical protein VH420_02615 [Gaiellaceae bacterium]|jgi:hypothetical protein